MIFDQIEMIIHLFEKLPGKVSNNSSVPSYLVTSLFGNGNFLLLDDILSISHQSSKRENFNILQTTPNFL